MSKAYDKYLLHPRRKLLEALADLIPDTEGFILISDSEKIISFDISSVWDYGSSDSIIELANTTQEIYALQKRRAELETEIASKAQKVARYNKKLTPSPNQNQQLEEDEQV
jgi:hypothetical protein